MNDHLRNLIFQAIDRTISDDDFESLQNALEQHEDVRSEYLRAVGLYESLAEIAAESDDLVDRDLGGRDTSLQSPSASPRGAGSSDPAAWAWQRWAIAASLLLLASGAAYWFGRINDRSDPIAVDLRPQQVVQPDQVVQPTESLIAGHATLRRSVDLRWATGSVTYREGDVLPNGRLRFDEGVAEIDFFCGATLIVDGPAELDVESDWSVRVIQGRLRASVPPAARGFIVKAADSEIIDLGTEFAVEVSPHQARVEVIDGEVELRGGKNHGDLLVTGQRQWLKGSQSDPESLEGLSTVRDLERRRDDAQAQQFQQWKTLSRQLSDDPRLIAYYPIAQSQSDRFVPNRAATGHELDGILVGPVTPADGRFGPASTGLEFDRPGARVRTRIDGEFAAFTFACWVRIDSLEHRYNSLFMGDGYENGEPHWQIHEDGRVMFSIMVDDTPGSGLGPAEDARLHRIYYTDPIWDVSKSGKWLHLAAVYDPQGRTVNQFVNGEPVSSEPITDQFHVTTLRIGTAEIGNWGQPLRDSAWFAVRNLNGAIDELAIFDAALTREEIQTLYEHGKPLGY
ncbi:LamG-like jellyroll fold domain-containing protein [Rhodopirellula sp. JC639]|uniref:LamG-like jellyroll fold domain-containing protein n=1 Tax=Stieleria mannarensis TaxID=2755585 RepID=UPI001600D901|nr:LamG-like jellyroll fold domain-containing protein [Rhodopirellula sp. JC639]